MKIAVCYFPHREGHNSVFPLLAFQKEFEANGFELVFSSNLHKLAKGKPDLFVLSGFSVTKLIQVNKLSSINELLREIFEFKIPFAYLSGNDATGPIDPEILPYVDLYLARQLVKNRALYLKPMRRHFFRDWYMKKFRFKNEDSFPLTQLKEEYLQKIGVSWNLALIDWKTQTNHKFRRYFYILGRNRKFKKFSSGIPIDMRTKGVTFRGNLFERSHDVSRLHRLQTVRKYLSLGKTISIAESGIISYSQYIDEMRDTALCLSPFGWGEVCYRDFEAFQQGTLLVKPEMDHIETYPDLYTDTTMISYKWDASDLELKVTEAMADLKRNAAIANSGHQAFLKYTSAPEAAGHFLVHFQGIINTAVRNFENRKESTS